MLQAMYGLMGGAAQSPLTQSLKSAIDTVTPDRLFNSMQTRGGVYPPVMPQTKQPVNSTQITMETVNM